LSYWRLAAKRGTHIIYHFAIILAFSSEKRNPRHLPFCHHIGIWQQKEEPTSFTILPSYWHLAAKRGVCIIYLFVIISTFGSKKNNLHHLLICHHIGIWQQKEEPASFTVLSSYWHLAAKRGTHIIYHFVIMSKNVKLRIR
jgi:hypothetical protein